MSTTHRLSCLPLLVLVACGSPPRPPPPDTPVPESMQGHFMTTDGSHLHLYAHQHTLSVSPRAIEYDSWLSIITSRLEGERFVAEGGQIVGPHSTLFGGVEHRIDATCGGTATYENDTWIVAFTGDHYCTQLNGTFPRFTSPSDRPRRAPRGVAAQDGRLHILVPPDETPFAHALQGVEGLAPGDAPCPVALRAPSAEMARGDDPGGAALHQDDGPGEPFDVIHVDSGMELPTEPSSRARYQAVYVRVESRDPTVDQASGSFEAGRSRGRAYLVDVERSAVVCVGDVDATNGDTIRAGTESSAQMWLTLQLAMAEKRSIALGMRAPVATTAETQP